MEVSFKIWLPPNHPFYFRFFHEIYEKTSINHPAIWVSRIIFLTCSIAIWDAPFSDMGLSENVGYIPNEIAIFHRDNDQQNHWVKRGTQHFQTNPYIG